MTPQQIQLVKESFAVVAPQKEAVAALFYARLFEIDPELRSLFRGDLKEQGRKLMATLALVVRGLEAPERLLPAVRQLGQRHVTYGVQPEHYETVGAALMWTLEQGLGSDFTAEVAAAWGAAYDLLSEVMISAGEAGAPPPASIRAGAIS